MIVPRPARFGFWPASLFVLVACATRAVPDRFPEAAAVSPTAGLPKPAEVTRALREDPGAADLPDAGSRPPAHQHGGHHHAH